MTDDSSPSKDPTFYNKAVSHIPPDVLKSMYNEVKTSTSGGNSLLESVMALKKKEAEASVPQTQAPTQAQSPIQAPKQAPMIAIDGYVLPNDFMTMLAYIVAAYLTKDKKIRAIVDSFSFGFHDINKKVIYEPSSVKSTKRKSKSKRKKKTKHG